MKRFLLLFGEVGGDVLPLDCIIKTKMFKIFLSVS